MAQPDRKVSHQTMEGMRELFSSYTRVHGRFRPSVNNSPELKVTGNSRTVNGPPNETAWHEHLTGDHEGLGLIALLDDGESVQWAAIDLDNNQIDHSCLEAKVNELGLPLVVCRSKSGGAHCYLFLEKPCLAKEVVDALTNWAAALGYPGVEIFPKQTLRQLDEEGNPRPGNWLNLPYFGGDGTRRYCVKNGKAVSMEDFLKIAKASCINEEDLNVRHIPTEQTSENIRSPKTREGRNGLLFSLGCRMRSQGSDEKTIRTELKKTNALADPKLHENFSDGPLADVELESITKQILKYKPEQCLPDWAKNMNNQHAVVSEGGKTMILNTQDWDPAMNRHVLTRSSFADLRNFYCHINVIIGSDQVGNPIKISKGSAWLKHPNRRQYSGVVFAPGKETPGFFNMWRGFSIEPGAGNWSRMQHHIQRIICCGNSEYYNYLIKWMAFTVQKPDEVPEVAVVLRGKRGTGKGMLARELGFLFNEHFIHLNNPQHVTGNFNAHLQDSVLCLLDEAFWAGCKRAEGVLKTLITEPFIMIEGKYRNAVMAKNHLHIIIAGNEHWLVPAGMDERRFFVLDVSDERKQDTDYFAMLTQQMKNGGREAMLHDLLTMDLTGFHPRSAPNTEALREQKLHSLTPLEAWWFERLWNGNVLPEEDDDVWTQEVPKEDLYRGYLNHSGLASTRSHRGTETQVGIFLNKLLPDGWPSEGTIRKTIKEEGLDGEPVPKSKTVRSYMLPPLESCRETWDQHFNQTTDWPEIYEIPF